MNPAPESSAPALHVRDLRKTYGNGTQALKGVSLDVQDPRGFGPLHLASLHGLLRVVSRLLGYEPGQGSVFEEDYLRTARRARAVVERVFYS